MPVTHSFPVKNNHSVIRVIPRLDIKGPNLVKGVHLEGLRVLGKPWTFAQKYYHQGADELMYIDSVASLYGRNNLHEVVQQTAQNLFIPLTVGGGIRSLNDIQKLLRSGADKVAINTAAVYRPQFLREAKEEFGSQCLVLYIEAKNRKNSYEVFTDNAREASGKEVMEWIQEAEYLGAGEILLTAIDKEGTGKGYDTHLIEEISRKVSIPVIASGGCGKSSHMIDALNHGASAVSASSMFHYQSLESPSGFEEFKDEGNIEFLKQNSGTLSFLNQRVESISIPQAKQAIQFAGYACRN